MDKGKEYVCQYKGKYIFVFYFIEFLVFFWIEIKVIFVIFGVGWVCYFRYLEL